MTVLQAEADLPPGSLMHLVEPHPLRKPLGPDSAATTGLHGVDGVLLLMCIVLLTPNIAFSIMSYKVCSRCCGGLPHRCPPLCLTQNVLRTACSNTIFSIAI